MYCVNAVQEWTESNVTRTLHFIYDESGSPYAVVYNNGTQEKVYYYLTDLQGNVFYIVNQNMDMVAYYKYDAWGNVIYAVDGDYGPLSDSGNSIGSVNPLLYRGYYYDRETALYYLQTRYYDPAVGRFLNPDSYTTTGSFLGYNMFAYCENNPVMGVDYTGSLPINMTQMADNGGGKKGLLENLQYNNAIVAARALRGVSVGQTSISVDFTSNPELYHTNSGRNYQKNISYAVAELACRKYLTKYGEEFLFSDECVGYEIYLHLEAYTNSIGLSSRSNILVTGYSIKNFFVNDNNTLYDHVHIADISIYDAYDPLQEMAFCYSYGIRPCYKYTSRDPFINERPRWDI